jgi:hypothetical protein
LAIGREWVKMPMEPVERGGWGAVGVALTLAWAWLFMVVMTLASSRDRTGPAGGWVGGWVGWYGGRVEWLS